MFLDPKLEPTIRAIIERRLNIGGGDCLISIKPVARRAITDLEYQDGNAIQAAMYQAVLRVFKQYKIELWGYRSQAGTITNKDKMPLSTHIYRVRR